MIRTIVQLGKSWTILFFIVGIGFVVGYLSYSNTDQLVIPDQELPTRENDLGSFKDFTLNFSILDDERYRSLQIFGENPVDIGITGERKNPFAPL